MEWPDGTPKLRDVGDGSELLAARAVASRQRRRILGRRDMFGIAFLRRVERTGNFPIALVQL